MDLVMDDFKRRRNQIPSFGNLNFSDVTGLPITQYFESAAGLVSRYSSCCRDHRDLYCAVDDYDFIYLDPPPHTYNHHLIIKPPPSSVTVVSRTKMKGGGGVPSDKRFTNRSIKEQKKQGRLYDKTEPPEKHHRRHHSSKNPHEDEIHHYHEHYIPPHPKRIPPKAVDEDLYKIPPELLLHKPKRKKMFGFFSCLVPTCAA
ncbi:hypothetical protein MKW98_009204 [Papaver atlanticum]|uniref:Uncharacterized protein n=1 Tax=Papaver atlanticum TaxID=357466 RepID=A0AAD4XST4_9MAGN|nr:hypothetical protein MKW98_009204 [Papaver atlanticum]